MSRRMTVTSAVQNIWRVLMSYRYSCVYQLIVVCTLQAPQVVSGAAEENVTSLQQQRQQ